MNDELLPPPSAKDYGQAMRASATLVLLAVGCVLATLIVNGSHETFGDDAARSVTAAPEASANALQSDALPHVAQTLVKNASKSPANDTSGLSSGPSAGTYDSERKPRGTSTKPLAPADAASRETSPEGGLRITSEMIDAIFRDSEVCLLAGAKGGTVSKERCRQAEELAVTIAAADKSPEDTWAYGMESEVEYHLTQTLKALPQRGNAIKYDTVCAETGCVVYLSASTAASWVLGPALAERLRADPLVANLNGRAWPKTFWEHAYTRGSVIVIARE